MVNCLILVHQLLAKPHPIPRRVSPSPDHQGFFFFPFRIHPHYCLSWPGLCVLCKLLIYSKFWFLHPCALTIQKCSVPRFYLLACSWKSIKLAFSKIRKMGRVVHIDWVSWVILKSLAISFKVSIYSDRETGREWVKSIHFFNHLCLLIRKAPNC